MKRTFVFVAVLALAAVTAHGADVEVEVVASGGNFTLYVTDTVADTATNRGIQGVDYNLTGAVTAFTFDANIATVVVSPATVGGFVTATSATIGSFYNVVAAQTDFTNNPERLFVNVGQGAFSKVGVYTTVNIADPMVVGTGTYTGAAPTISSASANVLSDNGTGGYSASTATVEIVPEPMTLTLLGIGALALIRRRK